MSLRERTLKFFIIQAEFKDTHTVLNALDKLTVHHITCSNIYYTKDSKTDSDIGIVGMAEAD